MYTLVSHQDECIMPVENTCRIQCNCCQIPYLIRCYTCTRFLSDSHEKHFPIILINILPNRECIECKAVVLNRRNSLKIQQQMHFWRHHPQTSFSFLSLNGTGYSVAIAALKYSENKSILSRFWLKLTRSFQHLGNVPCLFISLMYILNLYPISVFCGR